MKLRIFVSLLCIAFGTKQVISSYLDVPRLHFTGQFRADTNTRDDAYCNFNLNNTLDPVFEWNYAGTNEFEFINTVITSVIDKDGIEDTNSELLGAEIFSDGNAKLADLDVDLQLSTLYGLRFGLKKNELELFVGNWTLCVLVNDMWLKLKCTTVPLQRQFGTQSTSKIVDIVWSNSTLISEFKSVSQISSNELHVSVTLDSYSCNAYTIGRVYGTIGITNSREPWCIGGERKMKPVVNSSLFNFVGGHPCGNKHFSQDDQKPWTSSMPFKFDLYRNVLVVDLGSALPIYYTTMGCEKITAPLDIGELHFGYILNHQRNKIKSLGNTSIPYLNSYMWRQAGIFEVSITEDDDIENLQNSKLVVYTKLPTTISTSSSDTYILFHSGVSITVLLKETEFFVRPMGYYMARLQHASQIVDTEKSFMGNHQDFTLLVTKFGEPISNTKVSMTRSYTLYPDKLIPLPHDAVVYDEKTKVTNETGHVNFNFTLVKPIPIKRRYSTNPNCTLKSTVNATKNSYINNTYYELPIDGQVYTFFYCVGEECELSRNDSFFLYKALISILAFSTITHEPHYKPNWVDDIKDYFEQQHHITYVMGYILNMSNYTEVTLLHNIELLKYALSKDSKEAFERDSNYMPTSRNLSPVKRKLILKWLEEPCFDKSTCFNKSVSIKVDDDNKSVDSGGSHVNGRCSMPSIPFASDPHDHNQYFSKIIGNTLPIMDENFPPRPLYGLHGVANRELYPTLSNYLDEQNFTPVCNLSGLQKQLQQAVQVEFYTIPLYLTSLYSIVENHNTDAYDAIRSIVMQEMLHFVQAANILIAVGGEVMIDDPNFVPSYPTTGLPGGVLPHLNITLHKYNLKHVHDVFMAIEMPSIQSSFPLDTIGMFYKEIELCIAHLVATGEEIFKEPSVSKQVKWPWESSNLGTVYIVSDKESAMRGINEIIEQGEGAGPLNPNEIDTGMYAHFFRFEELVCQKRLVRLDNKNYAFDGDPIVYDEAGVYPMMDNPSVNSFEPYSYCYTQARTFHKAYRHLLKVLQKTFNGYPETIQESVETMESLQVHAKKLIQTPYMTNDYTGAPVWDYEWN